ncbi:Z-ring formation inhibitor MciZ [Bacillus sp. CHD6a]|nr:Z-ring formation inhibitor MciZ [Bacillus sp. CHD6a]KPB03038.1 PadR family transcriptional regulator [Bacillus sp. CHD6a]
MKVYVRPNNIVLVGKAWEIRNKLKEYSHRHVYVKTWINSIKDE